MCFEADCLKHPRWAYLLVFTSKVSLKSRANVTAPHTCSEASVASAGQIVNFLKWVSVAGKGRGENARWAIMTSERELLDTPEVSFRLNRMT